MVRRNTAREAIGSAVALYSAAYPSDVPRIAATYMTNRTVRNQCDSLFGALLPSPRVADSCRARRITDPVAGDDRFVEPRRATTFLLGDLVIFAALCAD